MLLKDLFKMVEQTNSFNELIGESSHKYIAMSGLGLDTIETDTFKIFKKALKEEFIDEVIPFILNTELRQIEANSPYFQLSFVWTDAFNQQNESSYEISVY